MISDRGADSIAASIRGADAPFQVIDGGKKRGDGPPPAAPRDDAPECPVTALGHCAGVYHFLDVGGQKRELSARQLGQRHDLLSLFFGDDGWLRRMFPKRVNVKKKDSNGDEFVEEVTVDFTINKAAPFFQKACGDAGLYGEHIVLRRPGIWPGADGRPIVHCGDMVLIDGRESQVGTRLGTQVWAASPPTPRPALSCSASVAQEFQASLQRLWNFRKAGGAIAVIGLLANAYLGAAARWRPAGFLFGGAGSGKSQLLNVLRACCPLNIYTNDTTKSGLETALNNRAMPSLIDETSDQDDQRGARRLLDLVLTASGGDGTKGLRGGGNDNRGHSFQVAGTVIMASINPPEMKPQHLGRFVLVELRQPDAGCNHNAEHQALAEKMRGVSAELWGRALAGWDRYQAGLQAFRDGLGRAGCNAREMDQLGALLAGWWVLTQETQPSAFDADAAVIAIQEFIRGADDTREDDAPRRMIAHLLSKSVQLARSTDRRQVGTMIQALLEPPAPHNPDYPDADGNAHVDRLRIFTEVLGNYGIRVIAAHDNSKDCRGRPPPRAATGSGIWFAPKAAELRAIFENTDFAGDRWVYELRRLESARTPKVNIRVGGLPPGRCVWISAEELGFDAESDCEPSGDRYGGL